MSPSAPTVSTTTTLSTVEAGLLDGFVGLVPAAMAALPDLLSAVGPSLALIPHAMAVVAGMVTPLSSFFGFDFTWFESLVQNASGIGGVVIIFVYSFLIAFLLPLPSEVVLVSAELGFGFGWSEAVRVVFVMVVSGAGKAAGSLFAFHIGQEAKEAGPIIRLLRRSRFDIVEWSERRTVELARKYGYAGLAMALTVPGFPDTLSIYAFAVLEEDYLKFALATFAGSVGRLAVTYGVIWGALFAF